MKLVWDQVGEKLYETGVDKGVLYLQDSKGQYPKGVAWNGPIFHAAQVAAPLSSLYTPPIVRISLGY